MKGINNKKKRKKYERVMACIILLILTSISLIYFISDERRNNILFSVLKDISASVYRIVSIGNNEDTSALTNEINKDYEKEIENLKKTLELNKTMSDKELENASVIKRSTIYWYNIITIDKGTKNGIKEGNAVINSSGLIGKVIKANKYSSDIKLITSKNDENYISAVFYIDDKPYYGLINEYDIENNKLYLKNVIGDFNIEQIKNIDVVTSGLGSTFSSGLLIGTITDFKKDTYGISNTIIIKPSADFNDIKIVTVIKGDKSD